MTIKLLTNSKERKEYDDVEDVIVNNGYIYIYNSNEKLACCYNKDFVIRFLAEAEENNKIQTTECRVTNTLRIREVTDKGIGEDENNFFRLGF